MAESNCTLRSIKPFAWYAERAGEETFTRNAGMAEGLRHRGWRVRALYSDSQVESSLAPLRHAAMQASQIAAGLLDHPSKRRHT